MCSRIHDVGRGRLSLRHLFHLGGDGHRFAVMGEASVLCGGHPDRDGEQREPARVALAVVHFDVAPRDVLGIVESGGLPIEAPTKLGGDGLCLFRRNDHDEVVAAHVTDESLRADELDRQREAIQDSERARLESRQFREEVQRSAMITRYVSLAFF